jgi:Uma2 family endonuclease
MSILAEEINLFSQLKKFTLEEYHSIFKNDNSVELIDGLILKKIPKSPLHSYFTSLLYTLFFPLQKEGYTVRKEEPITILSSEPEPDLTIIKKVPSEFLNSHPTTADLVIEVSVTSYDLDLAKLKIYGSGSIKEVWILVTEKKELEVYLELQNGVYTKKQIFKETDSIQFKSISIELSDFWYKR